jgi:hypothetical protein
VAKWAGGMAQVAEFLLASVDPSVVDSRTTKKHGRESNFSKRRRKERKLLNHMCVNFYKAL